MTNILKLLTEYNGAITSIGVLTTILGGIIGYCLKSIKDRKSSFKKENDDLNDNLKKENENLKKQIQTLNDQLEQYKSYEEISNQIAPNPLGGNCLYLSKKGQYICPTCWNDKRKVIQVFGDDAGYFECHVCKTKDVFNPQTIRKVHNMVDKYLHKLNQ